MKNTIIIGTRGSKLAMWQACRAKELILNSNSGIEVEIAVVKTKGDIITDVPLAKIGDEGLFTKAIEEDLLSKKIDIGVHSAKDMPTKLSDGLCIAAYPEREDTRDALLTVDGSSLSELKKGAVIGTSSLRRKAFLKRIRPDLNFADLRGNIDTRIGKLRSGNMDGIVMAVAALKRMGEDSRFYIFKFSEMLPSVGQGAIALEMREDDPKRKYVDTIDNPAIRSCLEAERSLLAYLQGGCQVPVGCCARLEGGKIKIKAALASLGGEKYLEDSIEGEEALSSQLGRDLAKKIISSGGDKILDEIRGSL